jgi:hypothetical protein
MLRRVFHAAAAAVSETRVQTIQVVQLEVLDLYQAAVAEAHLETPTESVAQEVLLQEAAAVAGLALVLQAVHLSKALQVEQPTLQAAAVVLAH